MVHKFEDAIKISLTNYDRARVNLPKRLGNEAVNHFKDSWRQQGFNDSRVEPWKPRKKKDKGKRRAILVGPGAQAGRLMRSFSMNFVQNRVTIINDTPYSVYHNYGTKRLPQRRFMGPSVSLNKKFDKMITRLCKTTL